MLNPRWETISKRYGFKVLDVVSVSHVALGFSICCMFPPTFRNVPSATCLHMFLTLSSHFSKQPRFPRVYPPPSGFPSFDLCPSRLFIHVSLVLPRFVPATPTCSLCLPPPSPNVLDFLGYTRCSAFVPKRLLDFTLFLFFPEFSRYPLCFLSRCPTVSMFSPAVPRSRKFADFFCLSLAPPWFPEFLPVIPSFPSALFLKFRDALWYSGVPPAFPILS